MTVQETRLARRAASPQQNGDLQEWAHSVPKIDLHRHLEGSLRLHTLIDIARENGIDIPSSYDAEQLRPYVQVTDDPPDHLRFLRKFLFMHRFYTSKETTQRVVREAVTDAALDNIRYLELRFNPYALSNFYNFPMADVVEWVLDATEQTQAETETRTCLILTIPRNKSLKMAEEMVDLAVTYCGPILRGIDLVGDEVNFPAERFIDPVQRAREAGLNITIHAGEWVGSRSVYAAVKYLNAQRIGHGIRAIEDSDVVRMLYEQKIALEVCPTSNVDTGAVATLAQHPLPDLYNLQLRVTLNTDDPCVSNTTLSDEYATAVGKIGMDKKSIYRMLRNAVEAAFIPPDEKSHLMATFRTELVPFPGALEAFDDACNDVA